MPAAIKKTAMYLVVLSAAVMAMIYPTPDAEHLKIYPRYVDVHR